MEFVVELNIIAAPTHRLPDQVQSMNIFDAIFSADPSSVALVYDGSKITYQKLREQTLQTAQMFTSLEVSAGDRVALLLHDSPEFVQAFIALVSMGAIVVPVNMALAVDEQRSIVNNSGAKFALLESGIRNTFLTDAREKLQCVRQTILLYRDRGLSGASEYRFLTQSGDRGVSMKIPRFPEPETNQPAFILYTSGSTGEPKGAIHTQGHIFHTNNSFCREVLNLRKGDRLFSSSRLPFAYGLGNSFTFPLLNGVTSILCREKPTPDVISRVFVETRPTIFFGVPVVYNLLLDHHRTKQPLDCSSLRLCVSAGEALPAHLGEEWQKEFGVPVLDGIGSTEMLHMFMSNHEDDVSYGTSGKLLKGYEARLLDEHGNNVTEGEGNLWIKGDSAALGYWEKPEETVRTFVDEWVRTGDLYRCDEKGYWTHMGRSDDCFKSSGQWVSPVEVEGVLIRHEDVGQVAVVEDFDESQLPCPAAFVVCKDVESNTTRVENELRELARDSLPRFKQPRRYVFVKELPYTATGKIQRFKLRRLRDYLCT